MCHSTAEQKVTLSLYSLHQLEHLTSFRGNELYIHPNSVVWACMLEAGTDWDGLSCQQEPVFCCSAIWKHSNPSAVRWSPALMLNDSPVFFRPTHTPSLCCVHHTTAALVGASKSTSKGLSRTAPTMKYMHLKSCSQQEGPGRRKSWSSGQGHCNVSKRLWAQLL